MPTVLNKYKDDCRGGVYIGRPSKFGNPFEIGKDGTREEVIAKFRTWIISNATLLQAAKTELQGKNLVCFCAPKACHGDILLEIANGHTDIAGEGAGKYCDMRQPIIFDTTC